MSEVILTIVIDVFVPVETSAAVFQVLLGHVDWPEDALVTKVPHEQLQADQRKDAETEDGQDHHIRQLLHRLDQSAHDGLQACSQKNNTHTHTCRCAQMHKHGNGPPHTFTPLHRIAHKQEGRRRVRERTNYFLFLGSGK